MVVEVNNEGTHAPYIGNRPAGMDVHGPGDPEQTWGPGQGKEMAGQSSRRCCFECSLAERVHQADKEIPGRRNSMSKGMGLSLRLQGAGYGRSTGHVWGRAGGAQGGQGQLVKSLTTPFPQRWHFILQATGRPGRICGVKGSNQMCVLERSLWLRVEENGVEAGRQGGGCGQSREKMTVARPEPCSSNGET